jgi:hypothetical protein
MADGLTSVFQLQRMLSALSESPSACSKCSNKQNYPLYTAIPYIPILATCTSEVYAGGILTNSKSFAGIHSCRKTHNDFSLKCIVETEPNSTEMRKLNFNTLTHSDHTSNFIL